jgi:NAD(P)-dependent dehydrogenase (short-subunit alcohol dehydrogenase family)
MKVININLVGIFNCLRAQLKSIAHAGSIVNLSSVAGHVGFPGMAPYCSSKHAILGLTRTAAKEAAWNNVRVNAVCP